MQLRVIMMGKTDESWLKQGIERFSTRIVHYSKFQWVELPDIKNRKSISIEEQKAQEAQVFLKHIQDAHLNFLLDEQGKLLSSQQWAGFIEQHHDTPKTLNLIIGGPYGFDESFKRKAHGLISFSPCTFSHQMVRLILAEQIYRAYTIIRKEPYHHA
jgi:23S rRNA (pseudouridine1915-N3)-methyltransferase